MRSRPQRRAWLVLVLVLAALGVLLVRAREAGRGVEDGLRRVIEVPVEGLASGGRAVGSFFGEIFRRERLHERIRELEVRVARLGQDKAALEELRRENERLTALLGVRAAVAADMRAARVIASSATGELRSLVLDQGERDGVRRDAAVISVDGLVGRVLKVGASTAVVQVIVDASAAVAVLDERSRVQGVWGGTGGEEGRLKFVPNLEDVRPGDRILASGLDGIYPKGVLVGVVSEVNPGADAFKDIRVRPAVVPGRLETVLVFVSPTASSLAARDRLAGIVTHADERPRSR